MEAFYKPSVPQLLVGIIVFACYFGLVIRFIQAMKTPKDSVGTCILCTGGVLLAGYALVGMIAGMAHAAFHDSISAWMLTAIFAPFTIIIGWF